MYKKLFLIIIIAFVAPNCAPTKHYTRNNESNHSFYHTSEKSFNWHNKDGKQEIFTSTAKSKNYYPHGYKNYKNKSSNYNGYINNNIYKKTPKHLNKSNKNHTTARNVIKNEKCLKRVATSKNGKDNKYIYYKVRKGDNLIKVSNKFHVSRKELIKINKIKNNILYIGMNLKIPLESCIDDKNNYNTKINQLDDKLKNPDFCWPLRNVYAAERDGVDGVKSIGIIITGKSRTNVLSSADGVVTKVGYMRGFGNYIILKHINKYLTIYSYLKEVNVNEGEKIKKGKNIGSLDGNKLHFQIGFRGKPADPLIYLSKKS